MTREITNADWKILRELHPKVLERFCQQILSEIEGLNSDSTESFHHRYLAIYELLQRRNHEMAQIFDNMSRSNAFIMLTLMKGRGLPTDDEFSRLSEETQRVVALFLGEWSGTVSRPSEVLAEEGRREIRELLEEEKEVTE